MILSCADLGKDPNLVESADEASLIEHAVTKKLPILLFFPKYWRDEGPNQRLQNCKASAPTTRDFHRDRKIWFK